MKFIFPIIFLAAAVGVFLVYIEPTYADIEELRSTEALYDDALSKATELRQVRDNILSQYQNIPAENINRLEKMVPNTVDNVRLARDIDNIARQYGMTVSNLLVNVEAPNNGTSVGGQGGYGTLSLQFSVSGTYQTLQLFLQDLENSLRLLDVVGISFSAGEGNVYDYQITLNTYWLTE